MSLNVFEIQFRDEMEVIGLGVDSITEIDLIPKVEIRETDNMYSLTGMILLKGKYKPKKKATETDIQQGLSQPWVPQAEPELQKLEKTFPIRVMIPADRVEVEDDINIYLNDLTYEMRSENLLSVSCIIVLEGITPEPKPSSQVNVVEDAFGQESLNHSGSEEAATVASDPYNYQSPWSQDYTTPGYATQSQMYPWLEDNSPNNPFDPYQAETTSANPYEQYQYQFNDQEMQNYMQDMMKEFKQYPQAAQGANFDQDYYREQQRIQQEQEWLAQQQHLQALEEARETQAALLAQKVQQQSPVADWSAAQALQQPEPTQQPDPEPQVQPVQTQPIQQPQPVQEQQAVEEVEESFEAEQEQQLETIERTEEQVRTEPDIGDMPVRIKLNFTDSTKKEAQTKEAVKEQTEQKEQTDASEKQSWWKTWHNTEERFTPIRYYIMKENDDINSIVEQYNISRLELISANKNLEDGQWRKGTRIRIPVK
ncbi:hypothetical protein BHU72_12425 [Desulfuribacillus stibiiarsenatis]|uniref:Stage VI sporulation protein D N-terminal domain-containing protein n=1 Tax=Desulfuribacillus stibiiarsenatis TaxID=1390249 RepID=A0A1E5L2E7_9FIRM|nr:LysM domain-containing protein [Desulfuribacillus stibiiarsenatis]OEH84203.1 hypothetical protein BHU72_12425 [Desulfuribacillus stibiiarsenatis]